MCIGIPMVVVSGDAFEALCARHDATQRISMLLIGAQPPGTPVLVHLGSAIRVLDPREAQQIEDALAGLAAAVEGRDFDHLFADLIGREPQLPAHLAKDRTPPGRA
jgi:hydrogenase expression/formation protein HypC